MEFYIIMIFALLFQKLTTKKNEITPSLIFYTSTVCIVPFLLFKTSNFHHFGGIYVILLGACFYLIYSVKIKNRKTLLLPAINIIFILAILGIFSKTLSEWYIQLAIAIICFTGCLSFFNKVKNLC